MAALVAAMKPCKMVQRAAAPPGEADRRASARLETRISLPLLAQQ
jgi:hypothetical protein